MRAMDEADERGLRAYEMTFEFLLPPSTEAVEVNNGAMVAAFGYDRCDPHGVIQPPPRFDPETVDGLIGRRFDVLYDQQRPLETVAMVLPTMALGLSTDTIGWLVLAIGFMSHLLSQSLQRRAQIRRYRQRQAAEQQLTPVSE